jgi:hypothetical protein
MTDAVKRRDGERGSDDVDINYSTHDGRSETKPVSRMRKEQRNSLTLLPIPSVEPRLHVEGNRSSAKLNSAIYQLRD